jgi:RNA polymerase sigma-70 factor (ECF subfamily)
LVTNPIPNDGRNQEERGMRSSGSNGVQTGGDDAVLISRTRQRDQDAFALLYDRYSALVYSVALRVLKNPAAAEDVLHDIFLQLWHSPEQFDSARGNFASWIAVIARNRAIDGTRRERPQIDPEDVILISPVDVETEAERNAVAEKVRNLLKEMPEAQRSAVEMAFFDGMTHGEIAAATREPLGTIKTRIRSALMTIRKAFER